MEILIVILDKSAWTNPIEGTLFRITFLFFGMALLLTHYTKTEWLVILLFGLLGGVSYLSTGRNEILRIVVMIAACKEINPRRIFQMLFWGTLAGCVGIVVLSITGVFGAVSLTQDFGRGAVETRYTLGMGHPNALHCMFWSLTLLFLYLYSKGMKWYTYLLLFIMNAALFLLTDSKASFAITAITIIGIFLINNIRGLQNKKWVNRLGIATFVSCILISILGAFNANIVSEFYWGRDFSLKAKVYVLLDKILTGRLHTLACTLNQEGTPQTWHLFSTYSSTYYFDLGWVRLFYWFGIIPAVIFVIGIIYLIFLCYKEKDYTAFLIILSISVYTIVEAHVISDYIARNYLFFILGVYWTKMVPKSIERIKV